MGSVIDEKYAELCAARGEPEVSGSLDLVFKCESGTEIAARFVRIEPEEEKGDGPDDPGDIVHDVEISLRRSSLYPDVGGLKGQVSVSTLWFRCAEFFQEKGEGSFNLSLGIDNASVTFWPEEKGDEGKMYTMTMTWQNGSLDLASDHHQVKLEVHDYIRADRAHAILEDVFMYLVRNGLKTDLASRMMSRI